MRNTILLLIALISLVGCEHKHRLAANTDNSDVVQAPQDPQPVDGKMPEVKP